MRRSSLYVGFILIGSYFGEKVRLLNPCNPCSSHSFVRYVRHFGSSCRLYMGPLTLRGNRGIMGYDLTCWQFNLPHGLLCTLDVAFLLALALYMWPLAGFCRVTDRTLSHIAAFLFYCCSLVVVLEDGLQLHGWPGLMCPIPHWVSPCLSAFLLNESSQWQCCSLDQELLHMYRVYGTVKACPLPLLLWVALPKGDKTPTLMQTRLSQENIAAPVVPRDSSNVLLVDVYVVMKLDETGL